MMQMNSCQHLVAFFCSAQDFTQGRIDGRWQPGSHRHGWPVAVVLLPTMSTTPDEVGSTGGAGGAESAPPPALTSDPPELEGQSDGAGGGGGLSQRRPRTNDTSKSGEAAGMSLSLWAERSDKVSLDDTLLYALARGQRRFLAGWGRGRRHCHRHLGRIHRLERDTLPLDLLPAQLGLVQDSLRLRRLRRQLARFPGEVLKELSAVDAVRRDLPGRRHHQLVRVVIQALQNNAFRQQRLGFDAACAKQ